MSSPNRLEISSDDTPTSATTNELLTFEYVNAFLQQHERMVHNPTGNFQHASTVLTPPQITTTSSSPPPIIPLSYNSHITSDSSKDSKLLKNQPIFLNSRNTPKRKRSNSATNPRNSLEDTALRQYGNAVAPMPPSDDSDNQDSSSSSVSSSQNRQNKIAVKRESTRSLQSFSTSKPAPAFISLSQVPRLIVANIRSNRKSHFEHVNEKHVGTRICGCFRGCGIPLRFPPRFLLVHLVESWFFHKFILFCILLNCITLAINDPLDPDSWRNKLIFATEIVFQIIFSIEMLLKICAFGVVGHKTAYFRQVWNIFDATIVCVGFLTFFSFFGNISVLRAVRMLRPLRLLPSIHSIKVVVTSFVSSIPLLLNAFVLWVFMLWLFSICGVSLMAGFFNQYCVHDLTGEVWDTESLCTIRLFGKYCPEDYTCKSLDTIHIWHGTVHFSNIFSTFFSVFIIQSLEGWTDLMYRATEAGGFYFVVYFVLLVVIGTFFIMNLILSILGDSMEQQHKRDKEKKDRKNAQKRERKKQFLASTTSLPTNLSFSSLLIGGSEMMDGSLDNESLKGSQIAASKIQDVEFTTLSAFPVDESATDAETAPDDAKTVSSSSSDTDSMQSFEDVVKGAHTQHTDDELRADSNNTKTARETFKKPSSPIPTSEPPFYFSLWLRVFSERMYDSVTYTITPTWLNRIRAPGRRFVESALFKSVFLFLVLLNVLLMTVEYHDMPSGLYWTQFGLNLAFTLTFGVELLLKIFFLGPKDFLKDPFNTFDVIVVAFSLVEIPLEFLAPNINLSVFRVLRLLRVLKLANISRGFRGVTTAIISSVNSMVVLLALLSFYVFITALLGMQLFGGKLDLDDTRAHFDDLWAAMLATFQLCTQENWHELVVVAMRDTHPLACLYFIVCIIGGNYILLNLFIAVLLSNVSSAFDEADKLGDLSPAEIFYRWLRRARQGKHGNVNRIVHPTNDDTDSARRASFGLMSPKDDQLTWPVVQQQIRPPPKQNIISHWLQECREFVVWYIQNVCKPRNPFKSDWSLVIVPPCKARDLLKKVLSHKYFEWFLMLLIAGSSVILMLDGPYIAPSSTSQFLLDVGSLIFIIIFTIEAALKIVAFGFVMHKDSYLRSGLNAFDFVIVVTGVLDVFVGMDSFSKFSIYRAIRATKFSRWLESYRVLRVFKTLRPIRFFNRIEALKRVLVSLISTIPSILNVIVVGFFVYLVFGIVGVQLFAGKMGTCEDSQYITRQACLAAGFSWEVAQNNFDNFFNACCALFESSTMEAYLDIMYDIQDLVGVDKAMRLGASPYYALFMILYMMFGTFIYANLIVGVLIDRYNSRYYADPNAKEGLSEKQQNYIQLTKKLQNATIDYLPKKPHNPLRRFLYTVIIHPVFETVIVGLVILNCIFMSMEFYDMPRAYALFLQILGYIFTIIFWVEIFFKLIAFGVKGFISDRWNVLDVAIQISSVIGIVLQIIYEVGAFTNMFLSFRVIRLLKVVKKSKGLRTLAQTLWNSLPTILNILVVISLIFYIFAVLGMDLFGHGKHGEEVGRSNNFETVWNAIIFLIRMATGENWNQSQWDYMRQPPECSDKLGNCVNLPNFFVRLYFYTFMITSMFVLFNLFVAVVLENFAIIADEMDSAITNDYVKKFVHHWSLIDEEHTGMIPAVSLGILLRRVGPPFGVAQNTPQTVLIERISGLNLKVFAGYIRFYETLHALLDYHFYEPLPKHAQREQMRNWKRLFGATQGTMSIGDFFSKSRIESLNHDVRFSTSDKLSKKELELSRRGLAATLGLALVSLSNLFGEEEMDEFRKIHPPVVAEEDLMLSDNGERPPDENRVPEAPKLSTTPVQSVRYSAVGPVLERALSGRLEISDPSTPPVLQQLSSSGLVSRNDLSKWFSENASVDDFADELPRSPVNRQPMDSFGQIRQESEDPRRKRREQYLIADAPQQQASLHTPLELMSGGLVQGVFSDSDSSEASSDAGQMYVPGEMSIVLSDTRGNMVPRGNVHDEMPRHRR